MLGTGQEEGEYEDISMVASLYNRISLIPTTSTDILPHVEVWGSSWNQLIPPDPHQIPPDPTRSHQIPPDPTNIMRLGVKKVFKKCAYAS